MNIRFLVCREQCILNGFDAPKREHVDITVKDSKLLPDEIDLIEKYQYTDDPVTIAIIPVGHTQSVLPFAKSPTLQGLLKAIREGEEIRDRIEDEDRQKRLAKLAEMESQDSETLRERKTQSHTLHIDLEGSELSYTEIKPLFSGAFTPDEARHLPTRHSEMWRDWELELADENEQRKQEAFSTLNFLVQSKMAYAKAEKERQEEEQKRIQAEAEAEKERLKAEAEEKKAAKKKASEAKKTRREEKEKEMIDWAMAHGSETLQLRIKYGYDWRELASDEYCSPIAKLITGMEVTSPITPEGFAELKTKNCTRPNASQIKVFHSACEIAKQYEQLDPNVRLWDRSYYNKADSPGRTINNTTVKHRIEMELVLTSPLDIQCEYWYVLEDNADGCPFK